MGAGATRAAQFSQDFEPVCKPPLNADFFTQLQQITGDKYSVLVSDVMKDVVGLFGSNFALTLEDYFTQLEFLAEAIKLGPKTAGRITSAELRTKRDRLMHAVSAVLEVSTDAAIRNSGGCNLHERLVNELEAKDTVISFNYDCVLDHALRLHGDRKWSAKYGYTFPTPSRTEGFETWNPVVPFRPARASTETVYVLKLHGSLHWQLPPRDSGHEAPIKLKQRLYGQHGVPKFTVIPPVWNKAVSQDPIFEALWKNAERALRNATEIAVVGFSFAPTDLPVESLFRVALAGRQKDLKTLVIANRSKDHRRRTREVFANPLLRGTVVRQFETFEEFVSNFPRCMS